MINLKLLKKYKYLITITLTILLILFTIYLKTKLKNNQYDNIITKIDNIELINNDENIKQDELCYVDIKGAIINPNVYEVNCDSKVSDVINMAGGLTKEADTSLTNLAKKITNEMVIIIYTKEEVKNSNIVDTVIKVVEKECICPNIQNDGCINNKINGTISNNQEENTLININTATVEMLQTLPGIGESKAKAIVKYREQNGNFKSIEEIQNVDGIGTKLYEEIKIYITT